MDKLCRLLSLQQASLYFGKTVVQKCFNNLVFFRISYFLIQKVEDSSVKASLDNTSITHVSAILGGGGTTTKMIMTPRKTQDVLCLFYSFSKHFKNRSFCAEFGQNYVLKKEQKVHDFSIFDILFFCSFLLFLPDWSSNIEQKRSCRRENRKMSFVFFVVGPPYPTSNRGKETLKNHNFTKTCNFISTV